MSLDKLTLHAELALLAQNATALDNAIAQRVKTIAELTEDLTRTRGARAYHDMVVQQIQNALAETERAETPPAAV